MTGANDALAISHPCNVNNVIRICKYSGVRQEEGAKFCSWDKFSRHLPLVLNLYLQRDKLVLLARTKKTEYDIPQIIISTKK